MKNLVLIGSMFVALSGLSQQKVNPVNNCLIGFHGDKIVSKSINNKWLNYEAVIIPNKASYIDVTINVEKAFDTIRGFLDKDLKANLKFELPNYKMRIRGDSNYARISAYDLCYNGDRITIFRDCGCGTYKRKRVSAGNIYVYKNRFFLQKTRLYLGYRNEPFNREFKFNFDKGLPAEFVSYYDSNKVNKRVIFQSAVIDTIQAFYPNGQLMYSIPFTSGKINGEFSYYDSLGNETFRVVFIKDEIYYFVNRDGVYSYDYYYNKWMITED